MYAPQRRQHSAVVGLRVACGILAAIDVSAAGSTLCNLQGNWTSGLGPTGHLVHIEVWQATNSSTFAVAAPWENHSGFRTAGQLLPDGRAAVFMVLPGSEGGIWQYSDVAAAPFRNPAACRAPKSSTGAGFRIVRKQPRKGGRHGPRNLSQCQCHRCLCPSLCCPAGTTPAYRVLCQDGLLPGI